MKTLLASILVTVLAAPAVAGPDFTSRSPRAHSLSASPSSSEIGPLDDVVFATNSTQLFESSDAQIDSAAAWLRKHKNHRVVLEGYADSVGMALYNEDLATRRAFVVRQHLIARGISPERIIMVVFGEEGAYGGEYPLDRRVVMYTTKLTPQQIARASIDRKNALSAAWVQDKALFTETKARTVISTR
jgi:outer membrane protein OmpA-like peptidoglycan-associated protein